MNIIPAFSELTIGSAEVNETFSPIQDNLQKQAKDESSWGEFHIV